MSPDTAEFSFCQTPPKRSLSSTFAWPQAPDATRAKAADTPLKADTPSVAETPAKADTPSVADATSGKADDTPAKADNIPAKADNTPAKALDAPRFFISRFASHPRHAPLSRRAVESIRRIYPNALVTVVDDGSPPDLAHVPDGPLTVVVPNPYPKSGEVGTLRVAWTTLRGADQIAVTMHDGMVLVAPLPDPVLGAETDVSFLWHFDRYGNMHFPRTLRLLSSLSMADRDLAALADAFLAGFNASWRGCFGVALAVKKRALDAMHFRCGIFGHSFMSQVRDRESRQAAERVVGLVAHAFARRRGAPNLIPSLCGNIFDHPSPWSTESSGHDLDRVLRSTYQGPFYKTWSGR
jgi:hypothetical protein